MLFDLEPYVPFDVFVVCCVIVLCLIASWNETKEEE